MSLRRPVAPDGAGGLSQVVAPDTIDSTIVAAQTDGVYGDGSDGTVTFDGTTTILGMAPSGSAYIQTRDLYLASATINSGVALASGGYRLFVRDTLTNNGTIRNNGNSSLSNNSGGASGAPMVSYGANTSAGGSGSTTVGSVSIGQNQALGVAGGNGGSGASGAGGIAGAMSAPSAAQGLIHSIANALTAYPVGTLTMYRAGSGGGGGGGDGTNSGSGGGGNGGLLGVFARIIAGTGVIQARGGNATARIPATGNTGGGGGGGGGAVILVSSSVVSGALAGQTIDANGGSGCAGSGTGTAGSNGGNGPVILIPN